MLTEERSSLKDASCILNTQQVVLIGYAAVLHNLRSNL